MDPRDVITKDVTVGDLKKAERKRKVVYEGEITSPSAKTAGGIAGGVGGAGAGLRAGIKSFKHPAARLATGIGGALAGTAVGSRLADWLTRRNIKVRRGDGLSPRQRANKEARELKRKGKI